MLVGALFEKFGLFFEHRCSREFVEGRDSGLLQVLFSRLPGGTDHINKPHKSQFLEETLIRNIRNTKQDHHVLYKILLLHDLMISWKKKS
jgi:hypothetical protein